MVLWLIFFFAVWVVWQIRNFMKQGQIHGYPSRLRYRCRKRDIQAVHGRPYLSGWKVCQAENPVKNLIRRKWRRWKKEERIEKEEKSWEYERRKIVFVFLELVLELISLVNWTKAWLKMQNVGFFCVGLENSLEVPELIAPLHRWLAGGQGPY